MVICVRRAADSSLFGGKVTTGSAISAYDELPELGKKMLFAFSPI